MSPLSNYLQRKERDHKREMEKFQREARGFVKTIIPKPLVMEEEDDSVEAAKRNLLRVEFNKKLEIYDSSINGVNAAVRKCIDKVIILYAMIKTVIIIAIVGSLTISGVFGAIILLIKTMR